jgi:hypothetical protein
MYNIKVGVSSNGQYYAAGMGIGVENTPSGMQSQVIFLADRFAVTTAGRRDQHVAIRYPEWPNHNPESVIGTGRSAIPKSATISSRQPGMALGTLAGILTNPVMLFSTTLQYEGWFMPQVGNLPEL